MISKEQALTADTFHYYDERYRRCAIWRRNGKSHTWKRNDFRFYVPLKHGLYQYYHFSQHDTGDPQWHLASQCANSTLGNDVLANQ